MEDFEIANSTSEQQHTSVNRGLFFLLMRGQVRDDSIDDNNGWLALGYVQSYQDVSPYQWRTNVPTDEIVIY